MSFFTFFCIMHAYCSDHRAYTTRKSSLYRYHIIKLRTGKKVYVRGAIRTNNNRREECIENISTTVLIIVYYNCCDVVCCSHGI